MEAELRDEHPSLNLPKIVVTSLRIFLNQEMAQLDKALSAAFERLEDDGRCCVICFNRWELAAVRRFLRCHEEPARETVRGMDPQRVVELYPLMGTSKRFAVQRVARRIRPTAGELAKNQRSPSSLHVLQKVARGDSAAA